jgi:uncharacterized protein (UPF0218 family)
MHNRSHNRYDIPSEECPVRVVKYGKGNLVTVKLRPGLSIVDGSELTSEDGVGATMVQFDVEAPVAAHDATPQEDLLELVKAFVSIGQRILVVVTGEVEAYVRR